MNFTIKKIADTVLIGLPLQMNLAQNKTPELWRSFMQSCSKNSYTPLRPLVSLQIYQAAEDYKSSEAIFTKWAGFFASNSFEVPAFLQSVAISAGAYAVFDYNGGPAGAQAFFNEVFTISLPQAACKVDFRPHFEILHDNYRENLQEEIWIPIQSS